jgi:hypothetical protein
VAVQDLDRDRGALGGGVGEAAKVRLGLDRDDLGDGGRVVGEVQAVADADFQHPAVEIGEELVAVLADALFMAWLRRA